MFGREVRLPDQLAFDKSQMEPFESTTQYSTRLLKAMEEAHELVRKTQSSSIPSNFNEDSRPVFIEGDLVLMDNRVRKKGVNPKLQPTFLGPFVVKSAIQTELIDWMG
jgi:hypothetical protein